MNEAVLGNQADWLITFLASFLIWIMFAGLAVLWLIDGKIKKEAAIHTFLAAAAAWLAAEFIKTIFPSIRPFVLNGFPPLTFTIPHDGSFPSSHTAAAIAMALTIYLHNKRLGYIFIVGALLIGIGRYFANVHFSWDILGGVGIGLVAALAVRRINIDN